MFPGETVRLTLRNELPVEHGCDAGDPNTPHCFNVTNMHSHGLWVSPAGNGDNVLLSVRPNTTFEYEYNISADHPAGTFWYHPHRHGSTALQVASGMAGALIVQGTRLPSPSSAGDVDTLLRNADGSPFPERVLVLQQIPYACRNPNGDIKRTEAGTWRCEPSDVGQVDKYDDLLTPSRAWQLSGRFTSVNGRVGEPMSAHAIVGRIERWRFIHAGIRATIKLQFRKRVPSSHSPERISRTDQPAWIAANCDAASVPAHWELAADGLTRAALLPRTTTILQPGYRSDLLVVFPSPGDYCVIDEAGAGASDINGPTSRQLLTTVTVDGTGTIADPTQALKAQLIAAAQRFMPPAVRPTVERDLENGLGLESFAPHEDLRQAVPSSIQHLLFAFNPPSMGTSASDLKPYDPARIDRLLPLGATEDWVIQTEGLGAPHPFHIHINPFQIISIVGPNNADLTADQTSEYWSLSGTWKDTLLVSANTTVTVRTRYRRYIGDFVLHCHILDHEDRGMMQNLRIVLPGDHGGPYPTPHKRP